MYFEEDIKPLILNKTNAEMIAKVWGTPFIEDWKGLQIILKVKKVSAFGEMVDAVRVANTRPTNEILTCESCGKPVSERVAAATKNKLNKILCADCARKEVNNG